MFTFGIPFRSPVYRVRHSAAGSSLFLTIGGNPALVEQLQNQCLASAFLFTLRFHEPLRRWR